MRGRDVQWHITEPPQISGLCTFITFPGQPERAGPLLMFVLLFLCLGFYIAWILKLRTRQSSMLTNIFIYWSSRSFRDVARQATPAAVWRSREFPRLHRRRKPTPVNLYQNSSGKYTFRHSCESTDQRRHNSSTAHLILHFSQYNMVQGGSGRSGFISKS